MLKSSNLNSIIDAIGEETTTTLATNPLRPNSLDLSQLHNATKDNLSKNLPNDANYNKTNVEAIKTTTTSSLAAPQLAAGVLQIFQPPLVKARVQLKELIGKQNKIYLDLSAEKFKLDNDDMVQLHEMMNNVKIYREKLIKIKKQMEHIYQRTKVLKKRAVNIEACKQKELQRKLQKQQQEESLIGKNAIMK